MLLFPKRSNVNGVLYFVADNGINGRELWKSDGTAAGTVLVKDIRLAPPGHSDPSNLINRAGELFFAAIGDTSAGSGLWKSDGTPTGTTLVKGGLSVSDLTNVGGMLFFSSSDGASGRELWKSDGTTAGTGLVKDIRPGTLSSSPASLTNFNGTLFFSADNGTNGRELWRSNGTAAGTALVKDLYPGTSDYYFENLTSLGGNLFFTIGSSSPAGTGWLYKTDGTEADTTLVGSGFQASRLTPLGSTLFFVSNNGGNGEELWRTDGSAAGTALVKYIYPGTDPGGSPRSSSPASLTNVNGSLFFSAQNGTNGRELWRSNGTAAGTALVKDLFPGTYGSGPYGLTHVNGTLFFNVINDGIGRPFQLWRSDGTTAGTQLVKDDTVVHPAHGTDVSGTLFFTTELRHLWKSNGTAAGTVPLTSGTWAGGLANINGTAFFVGNGFEPWKSDGSTSGTVLVKEINPDGPSMCGRLESWWNFCTQTGPRPLG